MRKKKIERDGQIVVFSAIFAVVTSVASVLDSTDRRSVFVFAAFSLVAWMLKD